MQVACPLVTVIAEQVLRNEILYMHACRHTAITRLQTLMSNHMTLCYEPVERDVSSPDGFSLKLYIVENALATSSAALSVRTRQCALDSPGCSGRASSCPEEPFLLM